MLDHHTFVSSAALKGWLELGRSDDVHETGTASLQLNVRRQESAPQQPCQGEVLRVIGLGPAQAVRNSPSLFDQAFRPTRADLSSSQPVQRDCGKLARDFLAPAQFVQHRRRFGPHQMRRHQLLPAQGFQPNLGQAGGDYDRSVDNQHVSERRATNESQPRRRACARQWPYAARMLESAAWHRSSGWPSRPRRSGAVCRSWSPLGGPNGSSGAPFRGLVWFGERPLAQSALSLYTTTTRTWPYSNAGAKPC
jgi:hypothetical protein